ncbi:MAG: hypothetical protein ACO32Z_03485, partial [Gemmatimonadaceae bacterium]
MSASAGRSHRRAGGAWPLARLAFGLLLLGATRLPAQGEARSIAGRVLLPGGGADGPPVAGAWGPLHR